MADEILYQARIHPEQKANTLSEGQTGALHEQMQVDVSCMHPGFALQVEAPTPCHSLDLVPFMQGVLRTAVEAGADSSKYPDSCIFHQKVHSKVNSCIPAACALPSAARRVLTWKVLQWESRGKGPKPKLDGKPIEYITVGGRVSLPTGAY